MRPSILKMTAFGPYSTHEVIDFTELKESNLFLITGPTGSGKTTIFDGICIAMYGETSGNIRKSEHLRSQFAIDDLLTEIELTFELRNNIYNIKRIPIQERKKKKSEGYTIQKPEATLTINPGAGEKVIVGVSNVNKEIESIMGINAEQFRQIMMIPQGDFRKLLLASSEEREKILEKLFDTTIYQSMQRKLDDQAKVLHREIKDQQNIRNHEFEKIDANEDLAFQELVNCEFKDVDEITKKLNEIIKLDQNELEDKNKQQIETNQQKENTLKKLEQAKSTNTQFEQLDNKTVSLTSHQANNNEIKLLTQRVLLGQKALLIVPVEMQVVEKEKILSDKKTTLELKNKEYEKCTIDFEKSKKAYEQLSSNEEMTKREELVEKTAFLSKFVQKVIDVDTYKNESEKLKAKQQVNTQNEIKYQDVISTNEEKLLVLQEKIAKMETQILKIPVLELQKQQIKSYNDDMEKIIDYQKKINLLENQIETLATEKLDGNESFLLLNKTYDDIKDAFFKNQSARLAEGLKDGEACPVCGSTEHIHIAEATERIVTRDQLDEAEKNARIAEQNMSKLNDAYINLEKNIDEKKSALDEALKALIEKNVLKDEIIQSDNLLCSIEDYMKNYSDELKSIADTISEIKNLQGELSNQKRLLDNMKDQIKNSQALYESSKNDMHTNEINLKGLEKSIEVIHKDVPEEFRSLEKLNLAIEEANVQKEESIKAYQKSRENFDMLQKQYEGLKASIKELNNTITELEIEVTGLNKLMDEQIISHGFDSLEAYQFAKYDKVLVEKDQLIIENHKKEEDALKSQIEALKEALKNKEKEDITIYSSELDELNIKIEAYSNISRKIDRRLEQNKKILQRANEISESIKEKEVVYGVVGNLAKVAMGKNSKNVSFVRFVLSSFLEDILVSANQRLIQMAQGRYRLIITDEKERKDSRSGLDLGVFDEWTGKERHVKTLSGGESFKASLAMALGLSDVVQNYAGGVQLDTMFIDEGFGTLDQESLDSAISCLVDLKNKGRLVGIISHVQELKERINVRLEVKTNNGGSHSQFYIG